MAVKWVSMHTARRTFQAAPPSVTSLGITSPRNQRWQDIVTERSLAWLESMKWIRRSGTNFVWNSVKASRAPSERNEAVNEEIT